MWAIEVRAMKVDGNGQAKILTAAEIDKLFNEGFVTARDRALFGFCLYSGCRISEACSLLTSDVYSEGQQIEAMEVLTIRKKNTKGAIATRQIDTHPQLKALLEDYVPGDRYVFPGRHRHNGSINPISTDAILKTACKRVGLVGVSSHSFRRTALTRMSNAGVPLRHIQEISGHRSLAALQVYLEVTDEHRKSAIAALDFSCPPSQEEPEPTSEAKPQTRRRGQRVVRQKDVVELEPGDLVQSPAGWKGVVTARLHGRVYVEFDSGFKDNFPHHLLKKVG